MIQKGTVEKIVNGGWGLVRCSEGVVLLNYVLPGEDVDFKIKEKARGILWGELVNIISPSPHRISPPCPYFGTCGGCVFQHIDYNYQKIIKREILQNDLQRIGHFNGSVPGHIIESPPYCNRIRARFKGQTDGKIGFIRKGTNCVIPIHHCLLFPETINRFIETWNNQLDPIFFFQAEIFVNPTLSQVYVFLSQPPVASKNAPHLAKLFPSIVFSWKGCEEHGVSLLSIPPYSYYVSPDVFFQVNPFQWENMLKTVESFLEPCDTAIDLYSGVGFFIPLLKKYSKKVIAVENEGPSAALGKRSFPDVEFLEIPAEKFSFPDADIIIVDPPRPGLSKRVIEQVIKKRYKKIIYISCSSASFSRDLKILAQNRYLLSDLRLFDLFPQTAHLETISCFKLQDTPDSLSVR